MMLRTQALAACAVFALAACGDAGVDDIDDDGQRETATGAEVQSDDVSVDIEEQTVLDILQSEPRFSTLLAAVEAANLAMTFETEGPITIFAPNNDAFANLPEAVSVDVLTAPENQALLKDILSYHVVAGRVGSDDLADGPQLLETIGGETLEVDGSGAVVSVGGAVMTIADLDAENGVVHTIDTVLIPPAN